MKYKILIIDDEEMILSMMEKCLKEKFSVYTANNAKKALALLNGRKVIPDIILLDINMPEMDGLELCQRIRSHISCPIIFLTARVTEQDVIKGLSVGGDDYITKPFSMEELTFRIEAILRRVRGKRNRESTVYKIGRFTFDTQKQILSIGDKQTKLTTKESELLGLLCAHANEILQRDFALKTIWIDDNYFNARSMDVYITKLRKHLKEDDSIEIINIHGKGYKLITPEGE